MEIKLKLVNKASKAVAIAAAFELCRVSIHTKYPWLAVANAIARIVIIAILYGPRLAPKIIKSA